jgi:hypothetical protein
MRRLRDETDALDPALVEAARLAQRVAALGVSPERQERVWLALGRSARGKRSGARIVFGALLLAGSAAFAGVAIHRQWRSKPPVQAEPDSRSAVPRHSRPRVEAPPADAPPIVPAVIPEEMPEKIVHRRPPHVAAAPRSDETAEGEAASAAADPPPAADPGAAPDGELVASAIKALRLSRDPTRAAVLLDRYLTLHPDGPLAEESLALSIEAASLAHDPRAAALCGRYLARYPQGRFAALARQVAATR